ncbi:MAG: hypothetical protein ACR2GL_00775 [Thermoleophilaceae bacterium]
MDRDIADSTTQASGRGRLEVDIDGGVVRLRAPYNPQLLERIRRLPDRRYRRDKREWTFPARREALYGLCELLADYDGRLDVGYSERALRRLSRQGPGRITFERDRVRLWLPYQRRRIERVRAIPELRFERATRTWAGPATRAGAIALLGLLADREALADPSTRQRLQRIAAAARECEGLGQALTRTDSGPRRRPPVAHWRHVTSGPVFEANPREWVEGVGWCVRVRVDPSRRAGGET